MLTRIDIPSNVDQRQLPKAVTAHLELDAQRIEVFQDAWDRPQIEQFVAADFAHVYQSMNWILETQLTIGKRFLEWGCGFAVVTAMASSLGLDATGIEAESMLIDRGRETIERWSADRTCDSDVLLVPGNFLPPGAERLADDEFLPSLGHDVASAYDQLGLDVDDFALVYSYPWPGEDDFHEAVFDRYAAIGAILMMFCGPNDVRAYRKTRQASGPR